MLSEGRHKNIDKDDDLIGLWVKLSYRGGFRDGVIVLFHAPQVKRQPLPAHAQSILVVVSLGYAAREVGEDDTDLIR
jgi:hypothetical protein